MADKNAVALSENLFFVTNVLARRLSRRSDNAFSSFGLSTSHALILLMISDEPEIQPSSLADNLNLKPSTITRLVQKLEIRDLVTRESEGRSTLIACTKKGSELANEIDSVWSDLQDDLKNDLGERYLEVLSEMISNAMETLENPEA